MLNEEQYSSDTSDDDYVPDGAGDTDEDGPCSGSEECHSGSDSDTGDTREDSNAKRNIHKRKKPSKKKKSGLQEGALEEPPVVAASGEEDKSRAENIWNSFKKDVETPAETKPAATSQADDSAPQEKITKVYEFAGETVKVTEQPSPNCSSKPAVNRPPLVKRGGLSSLASQLSSKKMKMSTLEKSKMDWDSFKKDEGIEEDLKTFNQGKMGFLERQAFLERVDVKQFEIEKNVRAGRRTTK